MRRGFELKMPDLMRVYVEDAIPDDKALERWKTYKNTAEIVRTAQAFAEASVAVGAAIVGAVATPAAGAIVAGVGGAHMVAQRIAVESIASDIDKATAPWQRPNNGVDGKFILNRAMGIYSYRGFSSVFWDVVGMVSTAQGATTDEDKDSFDYYIDGMIAQLQYYLALDPPVANYFPITQRAELLPVEQRGAEQVPLRSMNTRADWESRKPVIPQYWPGSLEKILSGQEVS